MITITQEVALDATLGAIAVITRHLTGKRLCVRIKDENGNFYWVYPGSTGLELDNHNLIGSEERVRPLNPESKAYQAEESVDN